MALNADLVIIGGGPAGCMAAIAAANKCPGMSIIVIDKDEVAPHRIGEALLTGSIHVLERAGLCDLVIEQNYHKKIGAAYVWGENRDTWYVDYPPSDDYPEQFKFDNGERFTVHVPRHHFDNLLRVHARTLGVTFICGTVKGVEHADDTVLNCVLSDGRTITASRWIDASGQRSVLGRELTNRFKVGAPRVARYGYALDIDWQKATAQGFDIHRTNIISSANGWMWFIHLGEQGGNLTSVGFVGDREEISSLTLDNIEQMFPEAALFGELALRDHNGGPLTKLLAHPDYSYRCERLHGKNWSLCGDAALFLDPILSQGVTLAMSYGFDRGEASAREFMGEKHLQNLVTRHYLNEGMILQDIVSRWYNANQSSANWKLSTLDICAEQFNPDMNEDEAFRYLTNLDNLRERYDTYSPEQNEAISKRLGL